MSTYQTAAGATVTLGSKYNAFNQLVHIYECGGCDGIRGFKTADVAKAEAETHAKRCTRQPGNRGAL